MYIANDVEIGSEKMVQAGIYARINLNIFSAPPNEGGIRAVSIQDLQLRYDHQKPQGQGWWVGMPRREYEATNPQTGQKERRFQQLVWVFPGNNSEYAKWTQKVVKKYEEVLQQKGLAIGQADPNYGQDRRNNAEASSGGPAAPQPAAPGGPVPAAPAAPAATSGPPAAPAAPPVMPSNPPPAWTPPIPPGNPAGAPPSTPVGPPAPPPVSPSGGFPH